MAEGRRAHKRHEHGKARAAVNVNYYPAACAEQRNGNNGLTHSVSDNHRHTEHQFVGRNSHSNRDIHIHICSVCVFSSFSTHARIKTTSGDVHRFSVRCLGRKGTRKDECTFVCGRNGSKSIGLAQTLYVGCLGDCSTTNNCDALHSMES